MAAYMVAFKDELGKEHRVITQSDSPVTASFRAGLSAAEEMGVLDGEVLYARPLEEGDWYEALSCRAHRQAPPR